ncbi:MAG: DVUA0089 family protein [Gammaproteobacteria bacterium]
MQVRSFLVALGATASLAFSGAASAASLSFTGTFSKDDDVQLFNFTVSTTSVVTLVSLSYAGGVNAAGTTIAEGGFDPILTLYSASGAFIDRNDDGGDGDTAGDCPVAASVVTGAEYDTCFQKELGPGSYTVSVQQFDNFHLGDLADGFTYTGQPNFTAKFGCSAGQFCDVSQLITDQDGNPTGGTSFSRTGAWAFDILNVDGGTVVPGPATVWLLATGIAGLVLRSRR